MDFVHSVMGSWIMISPLCKARMLISSVFHGSLLPKWRKSEPLPMRLCDSVYMIKTFANWSVVSAEAGKLLHLVSTPGLEHWVQPMTAMCVLDCETANAYASSGHQPSLSNPLSMSLDQNHRSVD